MKSRGRVAVICGVLAVALVAAGIFVASSMNQSPAPSASLEQDEVYYQIGQLEKSRAEEDSEAYLRGKDFTIGKKEFERTRDTYILSGNSETRAEEMAEELLLEKHAAYLLAVENGFEKSDEEIQKMVEEQRELYENADNFSNGESYEEFLKGTGMTNEEYWDSQFETLKVYETIGAWKTTVKDGFRKEHPDLYGEKLDAVWEKYYGDLIQAKIAQQNIEYVK